jgi:3-(3-hydroxy-phenyl)propionate hydroxylase
MTRADVAIVGYGPVGATLANLLADYGLSVAIFEREASVYHLPRAAHFDGEIMRVFQQIGVADAIRPSTIDGDGMHFLNADGRKLFGFDARARAGRDGWPQSFLFYQPELELALRAAVATREAVEVFLQHDVVAVAEERDHVTLQVRDLSDGTQRAVHASYVVGCDGARSLTRTAIGADLEDLHADQPWLVCDVLLRSDLDLPDVAVQYCDPARPATFVPMPGRRRRWEFMLMPGDDPDTIAERVFEFLAPWATPDDVDIERAVVYTFHALLATPWRKGRILLAGDSAHQMPPFLGQGMCSGIRDAANLAWKLAAVEHGEADASLLDTYESERSPHVRAIITLAVTAGGVIQTTDTDVAAARDAHFLGGGGLADTDNPGEMPPLGPGLLAGPPDDVVGHRLPQPYVGFDETLGNTWATLTADDAPAELRAWLASHDAWAVIVRPDRHVYGVAADDAELRTLEKQLSERLAR